MNGQKNTQNQAQDSPANVQITPNQVQSISQDVVREIAIENESSFKEEATKQKTNFIEAEHERREKLITVLTQISVSWLAFTALVIVLRAIPICFFLSDSVMIAFITSSLGTVLGLWGIGLAYYFFVRK